MKKRVCFAAKMCLVVALVWPGLASALQETPLTESQNAVVTDSGFGGVCLLCTISNPDNLVEDDLDTETVVSFPVGVLSNSILCVGGFDVAPSGVSAGFVGNFNGGVLGLLNNSTLTTLLEDQVQESLSGSGDLINLLGIGSGSNVAGEFTEPFDEICLETDSLAAALTTVTLNYAFLAEPGAGAADPATSQIDVVPGQITADGVSTARVTVQTFDSGGVPLPVGGDSVTIQTTAGSLASSVTDHGDGRYTTLLTSSTSLGTAEVTAILNGVLMSDSASVEFVDTTGDGASGETTRIQAVPLVIAADGSSQSLVTVEARDAFGSPVSVGGDAVTLTASAGTLGPVVDAGDGSYTATLMASTNEETAIVTGQINTETILDSVAVAFRTQVLADASQSEISADPDTIIADGASASVITVQARDGQGAPLTSGGDLVTLHTTAGTLGSTVIDHDDGTYSTLLVSSTGAGEAEISGTLNGEPIGSTAIVDFVAGPPTRFVISVDDLNPPAGVAVLAEAQLADEHDNPVAEAGRVVNWTSTGGGEFSDQGTSITDSAGRAEITFLPSFQVGAEHVLTGTDDDNPAVFGNSDPIVTGPPTDADVGVGLFELQAILGEPRFVLVVANNGPHFAGDVGIQVEFDPGFVDVFWTCESEPEALCPETDGDGDILQVADLPVDATLTYVAVPSTTVFEDGQMLISTATVELPDGMNDPDPGNRVSIIEIIPRIFSDRYEQD